MENNLNYKKFFNLETRTKYFPHFLIGLFLITVLVFSLLVIGTKALNKKNIPAPMTNFFAEVELEAKSAIVWDVVNNKELFSKNPNESLPLASLTKVMTAVTLDGNLKDSDRVKITQADITPEGDSGLLVGDTWKAKDLRDFTLITSSNDGAFALAAVTENKIKNNPELSSSTETQTSSQADFIKKMNETASKIGLTNSKFFNEHGLDVDEGRGGAYGSARDMATLFEYTLKNYPEILEATRYKNLQFSSNEKIYSAGNTNILVDKIPNLIASKTGYTALAGGNLVIAFDAGLGHPIIISVLGSTEQGRFSDVQKLVNASLKYVSQ